jgi:hypothetical protein
MRCKTLWKGTGQDQKKVKENCSEPRQPCSTLVVIFLRLSSRSASTPPFSISCVTFKSRNKKFGSQLERRLGGTGNTHLAAKTGTHSSAVWVVLKQPLAHPGRSTYALGQALRPANARDSGDRRRRTRLRDWLLAGEYAVADDQDERHQRQQQSEAVEDDGR